MKSINVRLMTWTDERTKYCHCLYEDEEGRLYEECENGARIIEVKSLIRKDYMIARLNPLRSHEYNIKVSERTIKKGRE